MLSLSENTLENAVYFLLLNNPFMSIKIYPPLPSPPERVQIENIQ